MTEIVRAGLAERANRLGDKIREEVLSWNLPVVEGVRGLGLLLGIGLNAGLVDVPEGGTSAGVVSNMLREEGLLTVPAGPDTVRLIPALTIPEDVLMQGLGILKDVLSRF